MTLGKTGNFQNDVDFDDFRAMPTFTVRGCVGIRNQKA
jgi:hypothetical protein